MIGWNCPKSSISSRVSILAKPKWIHKIKIKKGVLMFIIAELKSEKGETLAVLSAPPKEFKTGSRGFYANGKAEFDGKRYQVQIQIVEIGSKKKGVEDSGE
jgi:hypothetical protein